MKDQHTKITGYRDLSQHEINIMNAIKELGTDLERIIAVVGEHLDMQRVDAINIGAATAEQIVARDHELARIKRADPVHWLRLATDDLQTGLMRLTRAVAQPGSF